MQPTNTSARSRLLAPWLQKGALENFAGPSCILVLWRSDSLTVTCWILGFSVRLPWLYWSRWRGLWLLALNTEIQRSFPVPLPFASAKMEEVVIGAKCRHRHSALGGNRNTSLLPCVCLRLYLEVPSFNAQCTFRSKYYSCFSIDMPPGKAGWAEVFGISVWMGVLRSKLT